MGAIEFQRFGSLSRLFRDMTITEKIDGSNSAVIFQVHDSAEGLEWESPEYPLFPLKDGRIVEFAAQSRNRLIYPWDDNYGFAKWVHANAEELFDLLGEGRHFGEWWGQGIQRNYGIIHRNFSLFNTARHSTYRTIGDAPVGPVPVLYHGPFNTRTIEECIYDLHEVGSYAAPGFMKPEGVVIYHHHSGTSFKTTLDNNDKHKWESIL